MGPAASLWSRAEESLLVPPIRKVSLTIKEETVNSCNGWLQ